MLAQPTSKKICKTTNVLKGFKKFEIDNATGFPICPKQENLSVEQHHIVSHVSHSVIVAYHSLDVENTRSGLLNMKTKKETTNR